MTLPHLPPLFDPVDVEDGTEPLALACAQAAAGAEAGRLFWQNRPDRLACALVLAPDRPWKEARRMQEVGLLAMADALAVLGPPEVEVGFRPEGDILVNGASVGALCFLAPDGPEDEVPDWAVLGLAVDVLGDPQDDSPGLRPQSTALREEGFGDVAVPQLLECFARHLLSWTDLWDSEGAAKLDEALAQRMIREKAA
ncbi:biotin/lipoate--protein ligase family protein [Telmatospirillum sp. J64-1]|uniref:biotin/lipoate--protein ligase family protein n=1 Tax=Telmatospirillum sp. J64-1 TaxID=2502183 RepID=UPI00115EFBF7|nr:biotin/lipoate--protein ligase family protein [Telmatospirillum sp. J64-1]